MTMAVAVAMARREPWIAAIGVDAGGTPAMGRSGGEDMAATDRKRGRGLEWDPRGGVRVRSRIVRVARGAWPARIAVALALCALAWMHGAHAGDGDDAARPTDGDAPAAKTPGGATDAPTLNLRIREGVDPETGEKETLILYLDGLGRVVAETAMPEADAEPEERQEFVHAYLLELPFDVDFPGGTAEELLLHLGDRLQAAYAQSPPALKEHLSAKPLKIDVLVEPGTHLIFPRMQAKAVSMQGLSRYLRGMIEGRVQGGFDPVETPEMAAMGYDDPLRALPHHWVLSFGHRAEGMRMRVYNLSGTPMAHENIVAAMETAWLMGGRAVAVQVKYQPKTKLLMVRGESGAIRAADQVYTALSGKQAGGDATAEMMELREENQILRKKLRHLLARLDEEDGDFEDADEDGGQDEEEADDDGDDEEEEDDDDDDEDDDEDEERDGRRPAGAEAGGRKTPARF